MKYKRFLVVFTDARKSTRFIAYLNINILAVMLIFNCVSAIENFVLQFEIPLDDKEDKESMTMTILTESSMLNELLLKTLYLYFNISLKKSTEKRNVQSIKHWLALHLIFLIYVLIYHCIIAYITECFGFLTIGFIYGIVTGIMLYIVTIFYKNELIKEMDPASDNAILHQSTNNQSA